MSGLNDQEERGNAKDVRLEVVGNVCECKRKRLDYRPTKTTTGLLDKKVYLCLNCGKELSFRDMDEYDWSITDGPSNPDNNPYGDSYPFQD